MQRRVSPKVCLHYLFTLFVYIICLHYLFTLFKVADAVRLDDDEEAALGVATTNDLMSLAEILDSNPQEFIMEAYADPLKYFEPDANAKVNVDEAIAKVKSNDKELKELNLTNVKDIKESEIWIY